jgi:phosphocarrier protein HPr
VVNAYGLHLRPAEKFVGLATKYQSDIRVSHQGRVFNGKSILDLMSLAAECGAVLELEASGPDAEVALSALIDLVKARFHEPDPFEGNESKAGSET